MASYLPILVMAVLAAAFAGVTILGTMLLAPRRMTTAKSAPYECGIVPDREPAERFPVRFYLVAMIFIIFDIEIIFLYPWAVVFRQLALFGLIEMVIFSVAVLVALAYLISNGALDWGPAKVLRPVVRTTENTIRRVSKPARATTPPASEEAA